MIGKNPLVTVLMPTYNDEKYVGEAIRSILDQTFQDFEFIILNDGSTDDTQDVIDSFSDPRMVVIQQENIGLTKSLNKGLGIARGKYIARQDADDISLPERFEKQIAYLDAHPEIAVLGGSMIRIDESGKRLRRFICPQHHEEIKRRLYKSGSPIPHTSVMFRKQEINSLGGYNEFFEVAQDYELWLSVSRSYRLHCLSDVLVCVRLHRGSISKSSSRIKKRARLKALAPKLAAEEKRLLPDSPYWEDFLADFEKWYKTVSSSHERRLKAAQMLHFSQANLARGEFLNAMKLLLHSICTYPNVLTSLPKRVIRHVRMGG